MSEWDFFSITESSFWSAPPLFYSLPAFYDRAVRWAFSKPILPPTHYHSQPHNTKLHANNAM